MRGVNMAKLWITLGSLGAFLAVAAGAFGAHALKGRLSPEGFSAYEVGAQYQMYHSLALLGVGILARTSGASRGLCWAGASFLLGMVLFSGSLYALALTGARWIGAVTPVGGLAFLAGWAFLAASALFQQSRRGDEKERGGAPDV
jgi:uncharacterized membrane protein YgdD (TMEM256/DUF423 family)